MKQPPFGGCFGLGFVVTYGMGYIRLQTRQITKARFEIFRSYHSFVQYCVIGVEHSQLSYATCSTLIEKS